MDVLVDGHRFSVATQALVGGFAGDDTGARRCVDQGADLVVATSPSIETVALGVPVVRRPIPGFAGITDVSPEAVRRAGASGLPVALVDETRIGGPADRGERIARWTLAIMAGVRLLVSHDVVEARRTAAVVSALLTRGAA